MDEYLKIVKKEIKEGKTEPEIRQKIHQKIRKELGKEPLRIKSFDPYREEPMENKLEILHMHNKKRCDNCKYMRRSHKPDYSDTMFYCKVFSDKIFQERKKDTPAWASRRNVKKTFYDKHDAQCFEMNRKGDCQKYIKASFIRIFMRRAFWKY